MNNLPTPSARLAFVVASIVLLATALPVAADHDDSTPIGLRITVTSTNPEAGQVEFDVTMVDSSVGFYGPTSSYNAYGFLGQRFYLDNAPSNIRGDGGTYSQNVFESTGLPPAIDFGDGSTIPYTQLSIYSSTPITNEPRGGGPNDRVRVTYRGSFSHTYTESGDYTIRAFTASAFPIPTTQSSPGRGGVTTGEITTGNPVGTGVYVRASNLAGTDTHTLNGAIRGGGKTTGAYGITNTVQFIIERGSALEIPTVGEWGLLLLGLMLGASGLVVLRSGS